MQLPAVAAMRFAEWALNGERAAKESAPRPAPERPIIAMIAIRDIESATLFAINKLAGVAAFCLTEKSLALAKTADAA